MQTKLFGDEQLGCGDLVLLCLGERVSKQNRQTPNSDGKITILHSGVSNATARSTADLICKNPRQPKISSIGNANLTLMVKNKSQAQNSSISDEANVSAGPFSTVKTEL